MMSTPKSREGEYDEDVRSAERARRAFWPNVLRPDKEIKMRQRIVAIGLAVLATGLWSEVSIQAASRYHLVVVQPSNNAGQGTISVDRGKLHPYQAKSDPSDCSSGACGATYPAGTRVTLTATPAAGSTFTGWGGECSGSAPTCVVRMNGSRDVMAHFGK
jgi:hypothetical protein